MAQIHNKKSDVQYIKVSPEQAGRRIDNFLTGYLKSIPKTHLYKMLRKGEVRVNSARVKQDYRLLTDDIVRIPPLYMNTANFEKHPTQSLQHLLNTCILFEDDYLMAINKPAGIAVHAGSGQKFGVIEALRALRPHAGCLELVHRLDKATSGCLLVAKDHRVLRGMHANLRSNSIKKQYIAILKGKIHSQRQDVSLPLLKDELRSGERMVQVHEGGKQAVTSFYMLRHYTDASLVRVELMTGRTHQIRVHAAHIGHPVAGDVKYGDRSFNRRIKRAGLRRMFLHAESLTFALPYADGEITIKAPLPDDLTSFLDGYN